MRTADPSGFKIFRAQAASSRSSSPFRMSPDRVLRFGTTSSPHVLDGLDDDRSNAALQISFDVSLAEHFDHLCFDLVHARAFVVENEHAFLDRSNLLSLEILAFAQRRRA